MNVTRTCFRGASSTLVWEKGKTVKGARVPSPQFRSVENKTRHGESVPGGLQEWVVLGRWPPADGGGRLLQREAARCYHRAVTAMGPGVLTALPGDSAAGSTHLSSQGKPRGSGRDGWDGGMASVCAARGPHSGWLSPLANKLWVSPNYIHAVSGSSPVQHAVSAPGSRLSESGAS